MTKSWSARDAAALHTSCNVWVISSRGSVAFVLATREDKQDSPRMRVDRSFNEIRTESWPPAPYRLVRQGHRAVEPEDIKPQRRTWSQRLGFNARRATFSGPSERATEWGVRVPHWSLVLLTALPPVLWLGVISRLKRRNRRKRGLCANCGYDLRASSDRCPECGTLVPKEAAT